MFDGINGQNHRCDQYCTGFSGKNRAKRFMTYRLFNGINLIRNKLHKVHNAESWKWLYIAIFMSIKRAETRGIEETQMTFCNLWFFQVIASITWFQSISVEFIFSDFWWLFATLSNKNFSAAYLSIFIILKTGVDFSYSDKFIYSC